MNKTESLTLKERKLRIIQKPEFTSTDHLVRVGSPEQPDDHGHVGDHVHSGHKDPEGQDQDAGFSVKIGHTLRENDIKTFRV